MTEARTYLIAVGLEPVDVFRTAATPGASADENAIANLCAYAEHHPSRYTLVYRQGSESKPLAECHRGVVTLLVPADDIAADAMHCGPLVAPSPAAAPDVLAHAG